MNIKLFKNEFQNFIKLKNEWRKDFLEKKSLVHLGIRPESFTRIRQLSDFLQVFPNQYFFFNANRCSKFP